MKRILAFAFLGILLWTAAGLAQAQDITGDWQGTLSAGGAEFRQSV